MLMEKYVDQRGQDGIVDEIIKENVGPNQKQNCRKIKMMTKHENYNEPKRLDIEKIDVNSEIVKMFRNYEKNIIS